MKLYKWKRLCICEKINGVIGYEMFGRVTTVRKNDFSTRPVWRRQVFL